MLERVQRRATKIIQGNSNLDYRDRLRNLNMYTLEERRIRGDLIQLFKFVKQGDFKGLEFNTGKRTRGHAYKLFKSPFNLEIRKHFFYNRVIDRWNDLPEHVVNCTGVNSFKKQLDLYWGIYRRD